MFGGGIRIASAFYLYSTSVSKTLKHVTLRYTLVLLEMDYVHLEIFEKTISEERTWQMCTVVKEVIQPITCIYHLLFSCRTLESTVVPLSVHKTI